MVHGDTPPARHLRFVKTSSRSAKARTVENDSAPPQKSAASQSLKVDPKYAAKRRAAFAITILIGALGIAALAALIFFG